ncbi:MFS transporter [Actinopolyspora mortivallis]|uniref:MFS transporter n=1 Tax=Actinopolyspora mortivallis TaxID=33906 RepID=UPI00035F6703|nr:MFS transporter [Actinopolyspora mortivallis]
MTEGTAGGGWLGTARAVPRAGWVVLGSSFLLGLGYLMAVPLLTSYVASSLGASVAVAGGIIGAMAVTQRGTALFGGVLADVFDRRTVFFVGVGLRALGFAAMAGPGKLPWLVAGAVVASVGGGLATPVLPTAISVIAEEDTRSFLYSTRQSVANVAAALGPLIGSALLVFGSTGAFWGAAGMHVLVLVFAARYLPRLHGQGSSGGPNVRTLFSRALSDRGLRPLLVTLLFFWAVQTQLVVSFTTQAGRIAEGGVDADARTVSLLYLVNGSLFVVSQFTAFRVIKRFSSVTLLGLGGCMMACGVAFAVLVGNLPALLGCVVVFTLGEVLALPGVELLVSSIAPPAMVSSYFGLASSVAGVGIALGSVLGGAAMASTTGALPALLMAVFGCGVLVGTLVLGRRMRRSEARGSDVEPAC